MNMKKTLVSLAAASLLVSSAMAVDKGVDIVTTGQAVVFYQTAADNGTNGNLVGEDATLFDKDSSKANVGVQLNLDADLKNNFTFGSQITYLGTAGLEKNLVTDVNQNINGGITLNNSIADELALTKMFVAKKIDNTTVKIGRQELPKSLSPLAFSEDWNVFKNTFEAILVVNSDIPDTTLVGAYVGQSNSHGNLSDFNDMAVSAGGSGNVAINGAAYMLTVQNTSLPMATITASYYDMAKVNAGTKEGASAVWADVAVADKSLPLGLKIGLQAGSIMPEDSTNIDSTTALGVKASVAPVDALTLYAAYTNVSGSKDKAVVAVKNVGTGVKTPLYTQMVGNQNAIAVDASTFMLKAAYNTGDFGTVIAQGTMTTAGSKNLNNYTAKGNDNTDLELLYKVSAGSVDYLAGLINITNSETSANDMDSINIVRVWARYNF
jgi:hypothetical protein